MPLTDILTTFRVFHSRLFIAIKYPIISIVDAITLHLDSTTQVNTVCERELSAFILVEPVLLFDIPCKNYSAVVNMMPEYNQSTI